MIELDSLHLPKTPQSIYCVTLIFFISRAQSDEHRCQSNFADAI